MEQGDLLFAIWWYGVGDDPRGRHLAVAAAARRQASFEEVVKVLLVGIAAGLALYLAPSGIASIESAADFKLRFFAALGLAWLLTIDMTRGSGEAEGSGLALAGFVGVNAPPLALALSTAMICGGDACLKPAASAADKPRDVRHRRCTANASSGTAQTFT